MLIFSGFQPLHSDISGPFFYEITEEEYNVYVCMLLLHILLCIVTEKGKLLCSVIFTHTF